MNTMVTKIIHQDDVIGATKKLCDLWREEWGALDGPSPIPIAFVVYDLLEALGVSEAGIHLALGEEAEVIDLLKAGETITCGLCKSPAAGMALSDGHYCLVCEEHGKAAERLGCDVITFG